MDTLTFGPGATLISRDFYRRNSDGPVVRDVAEQAVLHDDGVTLFRDLEEVWTRRQH
jgi:hypothetical protein